MVTSAMLAWGPGCTSPPASRPPPAHSTARRAAAAAPDAAQSPGGSAQARRTGRAAVQGLATRAAGDGPGRSRLRRRSHLLAPPALINSKYPEPGNGPGPASTEGERRQKGGRAGGRAAGPGWGGGGELQVCNRNSSGWRAQICSCGRLPAVSFVPSDALEAKAPAPAPCLPPKRGSRLSAGALCPEGLGQKVARIPHKSRYCRQCSSHSWVLSTGCFLCAWLSGALFVSWD